MEIEVGQHLNTFAEVDALPPGTVLKSTSNSTRVVRTLSGWLSNHGEPITTGQFIWSEYEVEVVGDAPPETYQHWLQRFRTTGLGQAFSASVAREPVREGLEALGVPEYPPAVGMTVHHSDRDLSQRLPDNSLAIVGTPVMWQQFGVFRWDTGFGDWRWVTGGNVSCYDPMNLIHLGDGTGGDNWTEAEFTPQDAEDIAAMKIRAWALGRKAKETQGWCSEFELAMERLGINQSTGTPPPRTEWTIGQAFTSREEMWLLPVGATVQGTTHLFTRTVDSWSRPNDRGGTVLIASPNFRLMHLASLPSVTESRWAIGQLLASQDELELLPEGATVGREGGYTFRKRGPGELWWNESENRAALDHTNPDHRRHRLLSLPEPVDSSVVPDVTLPALGTMLDANQVAALPRGSLLRYANPTDSTIMVYRREGASNRACTIRAWGSAETTWCSGPYNQLVYLPGEDMDVMVLTTQEFALLPIGARVRANDNRLEWWGKTGTNEWQYNGATTTIPNSSFLDAVSRGVVYVIGLQEQEEVF